MKRVESSYYSAKNFCLNGCTDNSRTYFDTLPPLLTDEDLERLIFRDRQLIDKILEEGHLKPAELPITGTQLFWREDVYQVMVHLQAETLFDE